MRMRGRARRSRHVYEVVQWENPPSLTGSFNTKGKSLNYSSRDYFISNERELSISLGMHQYLHLY